MDRSGGALLGNWFEERAPPLHGVLADTGCRLYSTTSSQAFPGRPKESRPVSRAALLQSRLERGKSAGRPYAIVQGPNIADAEHLALDDAPSNGSWRPLPKLSAQATFATTYATTFGSRHPGTAADDMPRSRGITKSGMIGEVFKVHPDPQHDTFCQRVWLPCSTLIKPASVVRAEMEARSASGRSPQP